MIVAVFDKVDDLVKAGIMNDLRSVMEEVVNMGPMDMASGQAMVAALGSAGWFTCLFRSLVAPSELLQLSAVLALDHAWVYGCSRTHLLLLLEQHLIKHCADLVANAKSPELAKACITLLCRIVPLEQHIDGQVGQEVMEIQKLLAAEDTLVPVLLRYVDQAWSIVQGSSEDDSPRAGNILMCLDVLIRVGEGEGGVSFLRTKVAVRDIVKHLVGYKLKDPGRLFAKPRSLSKVTAYYLKLLTIRLGLSGLQKDEFMEGVRAIQALCCKGLPVGRSLMQSLGPERGVALQDKAKTFAAAEVQVRALACMDNLVKHPEHGARLYDDARMWCHIAEAALPQVGQVLCPDDETSDKIKAAVARLLGDIAASNPDRAMILWTELYRSSLGVLHIMAQMTLTNDSATRSMAFYCLGQLLAHGLGPSRARSLHETKVTLNVPSAISEGDQQVQKWAILLSLGLSKDIEAATALIGKDIVRALLRAMKGSSAPDVRNAVLNALVMWLKCADAISMQAHQSVLDQVVMDDGLRTLAEVCPPSSWVMLLFGSTVKVGLAEVRVFWKCALL